MIEESKRKTINWILEVQMK